jgi:hypothetical protein
MSYFVSNLDSYLVRDLCLLRKGDSVSVKLHPTLIASGWSGGSFVRWVDDGTGDMCVRLGDGRFSGYLPFGSNETGDGFTSIFSQNQRYGYATMAFGGGIFYTRIFETQTYQARNGLSAPTAITYPSNAPLYVSENGKLTAEDESDIAVNPTGLFPDGDPIVIPFSAIGVCVVPPSTRTKNYIGVQTLI